MSKPRPFAYWVNNRGIDERSGLFSTPQGSASNIQNMHVSKNGEWSAYKQGYSALTAQMESGAKVTSLSTYRTSLGVDYVISAVNGKIKTIGTATGSETDIGTGFTVGNIVDMQTFDSLLFAADGGIEPKKWTGSGSMTTVSAIPVTVGSDTYSKPSIVEKFNDRLIYANFQGTTKYPSHLVVSDVSAPDTITTTVGDNNGAALEVSPGDNQEIRAIRELYIPQTEESIALVFKDKSTYALRGYLQSELEVRLVNANVGALNNRCVVQLGNDLVFLDENNIYSFTTALQSGTLQPKVIGSENIKETLAQINLTQRSKAHAVHITHRQEVWFFIPTGAASEPDKIIVYRYPVLPDELPVFSVRTNVDHTAAVVLNREFFTGSQDGYIHKWFNSATYNGTGIPWLYKYPSITFDNALVTKQVLDLFAWFIIYENETIFCESQWKGGGNNTTRSVSKNLNLTGGGSTYDTAAPPAAVYDVSEYSAGFELRALKIPILGNGQLLDLTFSGTTQGFGPIFLGISGLVDYGQMARGYR